MYDCSRFSVYAKIKMLNCGLREESMYMVRLRRSDLWCDRRRLRHGCTRSYLIIVQLHTLYVGHYLEDNLREPR